ncbi:MAG: CPBP family intramembrane glutamate endopeptidase, partial [Pseudodesulfovibrio sp.]
MTALDKRPILVFLGLTFAATFALEGALTAGGLRFDGDVLRSAPALWLLAVMWIPGLTALLTAKMVEGATWRGLADALLLRPGS